MILIDICITLCLSTQIVIRTKFSDIIFVIYPYHFEIEIHAIYFHDNMVTKEEQ